MVVFTRVGGGARVYINIGVGIGVGIGTAEQMNKGI